MPELIESQGRLEIRDRMSAMKRVIFGLIALFPLLAPYELIFVPDWHDYLNPFFMFVLLISIGALFVSGFFIWAAVAGINKLILFDKVNGNFTYTWDAPIVPIRKYNYPITSIRKIDVEKHEWSDGSPSYSLSIEIEGGTKLFSGSTFSLTEIEEIKGRVISYLD